MIKVTSINRIDKFWVNEDQIEFMKETPDTILSMLSGRKIPVAETAEEIVKIIAEARAQARMIQSGGRQNEGD
jgi:flagellar protein FlbD